MYGTCLVPSSWVEIQGHIAWPHRLATEISSHLCRMCWMHQSSCRPGHSRHYLRALLCLSKRNEWVYQRHCWKEEREQAHSTMSTRLPKATDTDNYPCYRLHDYKWRAGRSGVAAAKAAIPAFRQPKKLVNDLPESSQTLRKMQIRDPSVPFMCRNALYPVCCVWKLAWSKSVTMPVCKRYISGQFKCYKKREKKYAQRDQL